MNRPTSPSLLALLGRVASTSTENDAVALAVAALVEDGVAEAAGVLDGSGHCSCWVGTRATPEDAARALGARDPAARAGAEGASATPWALRALDDGRARDPRALLTAPTRHAGEASVLVAVLAQAPAAEDLAGWGAFGQALGAIAQRSTARAFGLEQMFEEAPALISIHRGPEHRFVFANRRYRESSDGRPLVGRPYADAFPEFVEQGYLAIFDRIYRTGEPFIALGVRADTPRAHGDPQKERYWNATFQATYDAGGRIDGLATFAFEVTEHVVAMRRADVTRQRYDDLVSAVGAVVWSVDPASWRPLWVRGPVRAVLGCTDEEALEPGAFGRVVHIDDRARVEQARASVRAAGDRYDVELRVSTAGGAVRWLSESGRLALDGESGALVIQGLTMDASERHEAQVESERMQAKLLHVQKLESLGVLAGGVAHDFNNLLTAILGNASLAELQLERGSRAAGSIAAMIAATRRAGELARQLLAYSGRGHFKVGPMDINAYIRELAALLAATIPKKVRLTHELAEELPQVDADATQIQQVLLNLVLNGAEAIGDASGTVTIRTARQRLSADDLSRAAAFPETLPGDFVHIEVSDTGCGMDTATLARIFDPFFTTKVDGRGLGLAAVQGILRGHRGLIRVHSKPGRGTRFELFLPVAAGAPQEPAPHAHGEPVRTAATVLVVDDEPSIRSLVQTILEMHGYRVMVAADGLRAVEIFREQAAEIDLVLLDLTMPKMSGEETYRELSRIRPSIRVILSSGYNEVEATRRLVGRGAITFIQKPYAAIDILNLVEEELSKGR